MGNLIRRILYRILPLRTYFWVLSKFYFLAFRLGLLKGRSNYEYPYYLKEIIKPGDICLDIGGNLGYYTVLLSGLVGKGGHVHSVEPVKPVREILEMNTKGLRNVTIYPYALGTEEKRIKLGNNSISQQGFMGTGQHFILDANITGDTSAEVEFEAEMKRGSQLFSYLDRLDFIKCDIEGYEVVALSEMRSIIEKHRPLILLETNGEVRREMLDFFQRMGFRAEVLENGRFRPAKADGKRDILFRAYNTDPS